MSKHHQNWKAIFECLHLEEINLNQPNQEQIQVLNELKGDKRLKIKSFRTKDIEFMRALTDLEELFLEYVSGFSVLSPLQS